MNRVFCETIRNESSELDALSLRLQEFVAPLDLPPRAVYAAELALEETATNVIKYSYDDEDTHEIDVRVGVGRHEIVMTLEDDGHEFDPTTAPAPERPQSPSESRIGGLGIHLVRSMVDAMTYRRERGRNILEIRVPLRQGTSYPVCQPSIVGEPGEGDGQHLCPGTDGPTGRDERQRALCVSHLSAATISFSWSPLAASGLLPSEVSRIVPS